MTTTKTHRAILVVLLLAALACSPAGGGETPAPTEAAVGPGPGSGRCGDGVCEGPENAQNCPQDCEPATPTAAAPGTPTAAPAPTVAAPTLPPPQTPPTTKGRCGDGVCDGPENAENCAQDCGPGAAQTPAVPSSLCDNPNPWRAVVSEELEVWHNWLDDGGFEGGRTWVEIADLLGLARATVERSQAAARTGSWGYQIDAGPGQGAAVSFKAYAEKGDEIRFSFQARSPGGEVSLLPVAYGMGRMTMYQPVEFYTPEQAFAIGSQWTEVSFEAYNKDQEAVVLSVEVGPDTVLHIDDVRIEQHIWRMAEYAEGEYRTVGGIPVPLEPVAPLHFAVLIHIEDPARLETSEEYFWAETSRMLELARVLHEHGGFLTIQPEEDWALASQRWQPSLLADLVRDDGVVYSTHTHGPHCRDTEGRLRSSSDCKANEDTAGWDQEPDAWQNPWVVEYVRNLRDLLEETSGTTVTDHNGNWEFAEAGTLSEIPMLTWSAYKNRYTQSTADVLVNNPWRPGECNADRDNERFLTHDPGTEIVYIPGWGQNVARYLDRLHTRMAPLVSQFIRFADPDRVNTAYVVTHVGSFYPREEEDVPSYITLDAATGQPVYSELFLQDLRYWDEMLTELIDPLVAEGYVEWTSLPQMGELYLEWEQECAAR